MVFSLTNQNSFLLKGGISCLAMHRHIGIKMNVLHHISFEGLLSLLTNSLQIFPGFGRKANSSTVETSQLQQLCRGCITERRVCPSKTNIAVGSKQRQLMTMNFVQHPSSAHLPVWHLFDLGLRNASQAQLVPSDSTRDEGLSHEWAVRVYCMRWCCKD